MQPNQHVAQPVAEILNWFANQTPYTVDDLEEPIEVYGWPEEDPETARWKTRDAWKNPGARDEALRNLRGWA